MSAPAAGKRVVFNTLNRLLTGWHETPTNRKKVRGFFGPSCICCQADHMTVQLVPLSASAFPAWRKRSSTEYASDLIRSGESEQEAHRRSDESLAAAFPGNLPTAANAVFEVLGDAGTSVGYVWVGTDSSEDQHSWWVWDIVIDEGHRGQGLGRKTMQLAEDYARSQGARTLGLNVFGFNHGARGLYESLGYEVVATKMKKSL